MHVELRAQCCSLTPAAFLLPVQAEEAAAMARQMVEVYAEFATNAAAMPVIVGRKSRIESFAGANVTFTIEAMMGDRRALQAHTPTTPAVPVSPAARAPAQLPAAEPLSCCACTCDVPMRDSSAASCGQMREH